MLIALGKVKDEAFRQFNSFLKRAFVEDEFNAVEVHLAFVELYGDCLCRVVNSESLSGVEALNLNLGRINDREGI